MTHKRNTHAIHGSVNGYDGDCLLYCPTTPRADSPELAEQSDRLMLFYRKDGIEFHLAKRGEFSAGWVIGLVFE